MLLIIHLSSAPIHDYRRDQPRTENCEPVQHMPVSNGEKMEASADLSMRIQKVGRHLWRHRPCRHCGDSHFDSTCIRNNIPQIQRREQTQKTLKEQEKHTSTIDLDGDVAMTEWTDCLYCLLN